MTTTPLGDWRPRPDRVRHGWRCDRSAPVVETVKRMSNGQAVVCLMCTRCEGTDAAERLLSELDRHPGGDAA